MKPFWFVRKYMVVIGLVSGAYVAADQLAITSAMIHRQQVAQQQRIDAEMERMEKIFAANYRTLKKAGAFDVKPAIFRQTP